MREKHRFLKWHRLNLKVLKHNLFLTTFLCSKWRMQEKAGTRIGFQYWRKRKNIDIKDHFNEFHTVIDSISYFHMISVRTSHRAYHELPLAIIPVSSNMPEHAKKFELLSNMFLVVPNNCISRSRC